MNPNPYIHADLQALAETVRRYLACIREASR